MNDRGQRLEAKVIEQLVIEGGPPGLTEFRRDEIVNPDGSRQSLGTLGEDDPNFVGGTQGIAINNQGAVIGSARAPFASQPVWWTEATGLQVVPDVPSFSSIYDLNDSGVAVGIARRGPAFTYELGSDRVENLPALTDRIIGSPVDTGPSNTVANGISNNGRIVGGSEDGRAVRFTSTGAEDLNRFIDPNSGWFLASAVDVNDAGQIVGYGQFNSDPDIVGDPRRIGERRQFLLTPIGSEPPAQAPEPSLLLGLFAVGSFCGLKPQT